MPQNMVAEITDKPVKVPSGDHLCDKNENEGTDRKIGNRPPVDQV